MEGKDLVCALVARQGLSCQQISDFSRMGRLLCQVTTLKLLLLPHRGAVDDHSCNSGESSSGGIYNSSADTRLTAAMRELHQAVLRVQDDVAHLRAASDAKAAPAPGSRRRWRTVGSGEAERERADSSSSPPPPPPRAKIPSMEAASAATAATGAVEYSCGIGGTGKCFEVGVEAWPGEAAAVALRRWRSPTRKFLLSQLAGLGSVGCTESDTEEFEKTHTAVAETVPAEADLGWSRRDNKDCVGGLAWRQPMHSGASIRLGCCEVQASSSPPPPQQPVTNGVTPVAGLPSSRWAFSSGSGGPELAGGAEVVLCWASTAAAP
jgi:hypothetical protein